MNLLSLAVSHSQSLCPQLPLSSLNGTGRYSPVKGNGFFAHNDLLFVVLLSQGLEQRLGETEVTLAEEGRSGIPKGYTHGSNETRT